MEYYDNVRQPPFHTEESRDNFASNGSSYRPLLHHSLSNYAPDPPRYQTHNSRPFSTSGIGIAPSDLYDPLQLGHQMGHQTGHRASPPVTQQETKFQEPSFPQIAPPTYAQHAEIASRQSSQPPQDHYREQRPPPSYSDYIYRGGFKVRSDDERDGYGTDGSGSAYGPRKGYENFNYPDREGSLSSQVSQPSVMRRPVKRGMRKAELRDGESGEKQPFLGGVAPVRLTPSWEQRGLSKEELNLKNVAPIENMEVDVGPPNDRYNLVFLTLLLHGIGTLMPWNMFITAENYFVHYKFGTADVDASAYTTNFLSYLGYASQLPNVLFNWINIFVQLGGNLTSRIVWSILIMVIMFIFTVVLAMVDSSGWPGIFFWVTMASVVFLNIANGIYQNTVYGLAARLPFKYTGAVILGSNISGTFTAIINIIAIAMAPNQRTSAIYYFITALFVLLACFDTYFALPLNRFYRYHDMINERAQRNNANTPGKQRTPYWHIFKCAFPQLFNVFMVFFVTLAVFPAVLANTCRTEENFFIPSKYFQAVMCFLTFNLFAMLGNMLPGLFMWPGPKYLCIPVLLRLLFIPAFVLCHFYPNSVVRVMPVLIDSDYAFWVLGIFLGLTSGYYSSLAMMYCPGTVEPEHAPTAGMFGAASLITGIFAGVNFQIVCSWAVTSISFDIPGFENTLRNCTDRVNLL